MEQLEFASAAQKSKIVSSALRDIATLIGEPQTQAIPLKSGDIVTPGLGLDHHAQTLLEHAQNIDEGIFKILVMGEFKNGKSTLINAILGSKILPAKAPPTTAIITVIVYGYGQKVKVYRENEDKPLSLSWEEFNEKFSLTIEDQNTIRNKPIDRFIEIKYAQFENPNPLLANGVRLIDSPGLGEHLSRTMVTMNFLKEAHAIVMVFSALHLLSENETDFIEKVLGKGRLSNVFFVINRINQVVEDPDDIIKYFKNRLQHHFINEKGEFDTAFYSRRVFFVNAWGALNARSGNGGFDVELEATNVPAFERELAQFLTTEEKVTACFESVVQNLTYVITQAKKNINGRKEALDEPLDKLELNSLEAEKILNRLEIKKDEVEKNILLFGDTIKQTIYINLQNYLDEMHSTWPQDSAELMNLEGVVTFWKVVKSTTSKEEREKLAADIEGEIKKYLEVKFGEWSTQATEVVKKDLQDMEKLVMGQVQDFHLKLAEAESLFLGGQVGEALDVDKNKATKIFQLLLGFGDISQMTGTVMGKGDWGGFFGRLLQQIIAVVILSTLFTGGMFWIALIIVDGLHIFHQEKKFQEQLRTKIGEELHKGLITQISLKQEEIYRKIRKQFSDYAKKVTHTLQAEINEARATHNHLIDQMKQESFSVEQENKRLDQIERRLLELFNLISKTAYGKVLSQEEAIQLGEGKSLVMGEEGTFV